MTPLEIIELINKNDPEFLGRIPEKRAATILRKALDQLGNYLGDVESGSVRVPGLGKFHIKQVEAEKDGRKTMAKRTVFVAEQGAVTSGKSKK